MQLQNRSRRDSFVLAELCRFVVEHFEFSHKVDLSVLDQKPKRESGGLADLFNGSTRAHPSKVTVWVTQCGPIAFPHYSEFEGFRTLVTTWEEEFVLVLSHELRHIDQFYTTTPADYERDAESYAISVLGAFKASNAQREAA